MIPPTITISGITKSGKSTLAHIIQAALLAQGINTNVVDDTDFSTIERTFGERVKPLRGQVVTIQTQQVARIALDET